MAKRNRFVVCIVNDGFPTSLEVRKIYEVIPDAEAAKLKLLRVIDESGEDYLFPEEFFRPIEVPQDLQSAPRQGY
jgi:hypothetical protein